MTFLNLRIVSHNSCMNCWLSSKVCRLVGLSKLLPCSLNGLHFWVRVYLHPCINRTICVRTWDDALIRSFGFWLFNANVIDNYGSVQGMVTIVTTSKSCASCIVFLTSMGLAWLGSWFCVCIYGDLLLRCCDLLIKYFKWYIFRIIFILLNSMSWDSMYTRSNAWALN